jgi:uncharacterized repeat protein (TIGR03803 family)
MKTKHLKTTVLIGAWFGSLALASAQPVITAQPTNHFLNAPSTVTFSVTATGAGSLSYQWLFNGTTISGATNRTYTLASPQPAQWGYYSAIVSNASGSVTSQVAELKIFTAAGHSLSGIQPQADGSMSLTFAGETTAAFAPYYDLYPLETSSNLVNWAPLTTLQRSNTALDPLQFTDTNAPQFNERFYRTPTNVLATPDPAPTGPYAVGTFSMVMIDPSRTNSSGGTNYQFMTTFWYPTIPQAGVLPAAYVEPQVALAPAGRSYYNLTGYGGGNFSSQVAAFSSQSLSNAPLSTNFATYPVILYSPGLGSHRRDNTADAEDLASWGYLVVGLDTSDTFVSVFPNGKVAYGITVNDVFDWSDAQAVAAIESRVRDLQFVLDQLAVLNASDSRLAGRLDLDEIGAFGWSLGGATVAQLCLRDARCRAGAGLDGSYFETNVLSQPLGVPWLFIRSDGGPDPDPSNWMDGRPDDIFETYNEQVSNAYWAKLVSTDHMRMGDLGLILDSASLVAMTGTPMSGQFLAPPRVSQIVRAYLLSFFNKFLKDEDDHLLDCPSPAYPEVLQFLSKSTVSNAPAYPKGGLVQDNDGNLYGTTAYGGESGDGTVFKVTTNGLLTILVSFNGANGSHPFAGLVEGSDGNFYGTTAFGGTNGNSGTIFQITSSGALTTLAQFNGANGSYCVRRLVQGSDGNFYGTTAGGGADNFGTVFKMNPGGTVSTLVSFTGGDGSAPFAELVQGSDGNFYGTTAAGSASGGGTVFKMTPAGTLTTLVSFTGVNGLYPGAALVQGTNGMLYGTAYDGGTTALNGGAGFGTVFRMSTAGAFTTLAQFNGVADGFYPLSGLVQGSDGNFYGTTAAGGTGGSMGGGTVFKMTPVGTLTTLVSFNGANGNSPQAPLIQASDGNFYGTTTYGGPNGGGTVFQVTTNGVLTTLVAFGSQANSP